MTTLTELLYSVFIFQEILFVFTCSSRRQHKISLNIELHMSKFGKHFRKYLDLTNFLTSLLLKRNILNHVRHIPTQIK